MKSDIEKNTGILDDQYKTELGALDLFDRIINLKLTVAGGEEYVIRSDFETYFPDLIESVAGNDFGTFTSLTKCYIRKCQNKPSIKVQYKRVSMTTPVAIDIFISNFYMLDKSGKMLKTFSSLNNPLRRVDLQLGYFGQFESAMKANKSVTMEKLFDFNPDKMKGHGITVLTMADVEYVQTDKLPPDMTVHIHGYVGNLYSEGSVKGKVPTTYEEKVNSPTSIEYTSATVKTILGQLLFNCVTKNWINPCRISPLKLKALGIPMNNPKDPTDMTVRDTLTDPQAYQFGVQVYLSKEAEKWAEEYDKVTELKNGKAEEYKSKLITIEKASNALAKTNLIKNAMGITDFCVTTIPSSGDLLIYKSSEMKKVSDMLKGTDLEKQYKGDALNIYWNKKLPAVYNITTDALCTISCPFFFFLNPFQEFEFKSAYALSGIVSYYANFTASEDKFYALWQTVSFATVEDVNECTIVCTGGR